MLIVNLNELNLNGNLCLALQLFFLLKNVIEANLDHSLLVLIADHCECFSCAGCSVGKNASIDSLE